MGRKGRTAAAPETIRITPKGRTRLTAERGIWQDFFVALNRVAGIERG